MTDRELLEAVIMTEWGFKGADAPLIKHEERGETGEHRYFLACITDETGKE